MTTTLGTPAESARELYVKTPVTAEEVFKAIGRLSKAARDEIDRLLRFLDEKDNHTEREPDDEGDDADAEPSLGSFDLMTDQAKAWQQRSLWAFPAPDGEQDDADNEQSEASGIGDQDGLDEQVPFRDWQNGGWSDGKRRPN